MNIESYLEKLNKKKIIDKTYDELAKSAVLLIKDNLSHKKNFKFHGVYILTDTEKDEEVIYVGSAYVRTVHERLLQYTSDKDTGNTLIKDLIDLEFVSSPNEAVEKIKKLKVYAFKDESLEYKMIGAAETLLANKAGIKKNK